VKTLKEQGFGKSSSMESSTNDEIKILLEKWNSELDSSDGILEVHNAFALPAAKILWKMIVSSVGMY
jgi:hypothetical protein